MEKTKTAQTVKERWEKPVNRIGTLTIVLCILATFVPGLYLIIRYDAWLGWAAFRGALLLGVVYFGVNWIVEPLAYYPALGNAGTYLSWLAGSVAQQRIPASVTAKTSLGLEDGTQEAEVVSVAAICGSIVTNLVVLTLTAIFGTLILNAMPEAVSNALSNYILPGMFGAMLAMFGCSAPILTIPVFAVLIVVNVLADKGFLGPVAVAIPILAIVGTILYARVLYKLGKRKGQKKRAE